VIVQVKDNQPKLLEHCQTIAAENMPESTYQGCPPVIRNRLEKREVEVFNADLAPDHEWYEPIKNIIRVRRITQRFNTQEKSWNHSEEVAYYCASFGCWEAEHFARAIRGHWGIENRNHYVKDVTLKEDASRIRRNPGIFARLRSFALNILPKNNITHVSEALFDNALNINNVLQYQFVM
jgi:Transposase